jgi:hypothetical protein
MVFYLLSLKNPPQLSKKVSSVVTKKNLVKFGKKWAIILRGIGFWEK